MMSKKSPQLRFEGFTDDWEERKLSELIQKGGSGGTPKSTNKTYYDGDIPFLGISDISKSNGYIDDTEKHISEKGLNNSSAWIVPKGAISLAMYASVGKLAILNIDAATSQAFYNMVFEYESIRDYVYHRLGRANDLGEWTKLISTGTQANLNADKVKNFEIQVPQSIDEMKDISTFFNQLDIFITLQQRKLDLLKEQKKGYLQKMFPKNGAKVPELRFAGFVDDWEQRKLSDLMTFSNGINAPKENYGKGTKMISVMDILNPLPIKYDNILNSVSVDKKIEDKNKVENGDLIFVRSSEIVEEVGWAKAYKEARYALYSGFAIRGKRISSYNAYFIELTLNYANRKEIERRAGGSTRFNVSQEILNSLTVLTPSISEQNQIDLFFTKIDDTITLHQHKLDLLKEQKKGFLQKMFV